MAASSADIEEFLSGPLVAWLSTCVKKPEALQVYETFFDGSPLNEVLLRIDPEPSHPVPTITNLQGLSIVVARIKIFHSIIKNVKSIYEDELGQFVIALPDCVVMGKSPASQHALENLRLLLLLLLGCAVQGPTKEHFITKIKELPLETQHDIVECIKQVTNDQSVVLTEDATEQPPDKLYVHLRSLASERDVLFHSWIVDLGQETTATGVSIAAEGVHSNHLAIELADWKARLRKQRQELDEKNELLTECREELEHTNQLIAKLKTENGDLTVEARKGKLYRDEVDAMREKAERADKLEAEVQRYRERLADAEFYKVRVDELREDNRLLLETREMLEVQLTRARKRSERVLELETELLTAKQNINDIVLERDAVKEKLQELIDENIQLQQVTKDVLHETNTSLSLDSEADEPNSGDNSLSEQLTNNAQTRALKLELENRRLLSTIDSLKEQSFHESSKKILDLEKEKKKFMLKVEQLQENVERMTSQNSELENLFRNALQENRKLQDSLDTGKILSDRQTQELQNEKTKIGELEKNVEAVTKEKQRLQSFCDTIRKRADDAEKSLSQVNERVAALQVEADRVKSVEKEREELVGKLSVVEKEHNGMQKEVTRLKEVIEAKDVSLDQSSEKCEKLENNITKLIKEKELNIAQIEKLQDYEKRTQELQSQTAIYTETISALQKDLIGEKINSEKLKTCLEKIGLHPNMAENDDLSIIIENILKNPEIANRITVLLKDRIYNVDSNETACAKCSGTLDSLESDLLSQTEQVVSSISAEWNKQCEKLCSELTNMQQLNKQLQTENARMQVSIATLTSQVNSLTAQQTALQLANSQLVAEKEELAEQQKIQNNQHDTLLLDQVTIRTLHEQLSAEYEDLKVEQESLKKLNRDLRCELRTIKDKNLSGDKKILTLEQEKEALRNESKSLSNLRAEHSKLKDDFRNLFTANERLKSEYRGLQEEYRTLKSETGRLRLGNTEMQGELNSRSDLVAGLQLDNAKLQQKCDMLFEMNHSLDADRRALMDHVSQLLSQYHSLLTHSLEDKQHYHLEEKLFTDKLNNLCRQKEKLEEKIMEHYRKLDNASAKKKSFGATLVRRVRKAGSDIINKTSRNRRSWHDDGRLAQSPFVLGGTGSGESAGNDSDNSVEDPTHRTTDQPARKGSGSLHGHKPRDEIALRRSHRDLSSHRNSIAGEPLYSSREPGSALSLGSVGTRRTVYLSEDEPPVTSTPATQNAAPLLVFNRISTVIGAEPQRSSPAPNPAEDSAVVTNTTREKEATTATDNKKKADGAKENAIWYEYGCV
ncbi:hook protein [Holotrichia oblita]|uniref:Hook protein n=1 Tax=Holotrichia oblita TaxID=644536 RepID=A0ACB9SVR9_HOLOL|nr:hook protein [Holotrichia oblita]